MIAGLLFQGEGAMKIGEKALGSQQCLKLQLLMGETDS